MSEATTRFALPLLQPGQAQKEVTHNEALARVDLALAASVVAAGLNTPPPAPQPGQCWIVGDAPTGAWGSEAGALAGWTEGGWRFIVPPEGFELWNQATGVTMRRRASGWVSGVLSGHSVEVGGKQVVGARQPAIPEASGGGSPDPEARAAIAAIVATLRNHGLVDR